MWFLQGYFTIDVSLQKSQTLVTTVFRQSRQKLSMKREIITGMSSSASDQELSLVWLCLPLENKLNKVSRK